MEQIDPKQLLAKVARILDKLGIPYMVTGGIAVLVWGRPRFTADIDIVIQLKAENIKMLSSELMKISEFGYVDKDTMLEALQKHGEFNFIEGDTGVKVDFWVLDKETDELKRRVMKTVDNYSIYFISPEDLILSKFRWRNESASSRHIEDIESVFKISGDKLDKKYLIKKSKDQEYEGLLMDLFNKIS